jgi:choline-sulfatase
LLRWPGLPPSVEPGLCYQLDVFASVVELLGGKVPDGWDGAGFAAPLRAGTAALRDHLVITQGAWSCQRGVRWDRYLALHTRHDGYHGWPEWMLFDVEADAHEQHDLASARPELVQHARALLERWRSAAIAGNPGAVDPLDTVLAEGGPAHVRGQLSAYLERLRATGRADWAERLRAAHPNEP